MSQEAKNAPLARFTYPRLLAVQFTVAVPNATANATDFFSSNIEIALLVAIIKGAGAGIDSGSGATTHWFGASVGSFDPAIEELSFAGIQVITPAEVAIRGMTVDGNDLGVSVDPNTTSAILAQVLSFGVLSAPRVSSLSTYVKPMEMPYRSIQFQARTTALTTAPHTVTVNIAFYVTRRRDLR